MNGIDHWAELMYETDGDSDDNSASLEHWLGVAEMRLLNYNTSSICEA